MAPPMATANALKIIHLSDVHLPRWNRADQRTLIRSLMSALRREREVAPPGLVAITGDLFESVYSGSDLRLQALHFFADLSGALGDVPTVVIPGNHDRREHGVVGPHRPAFFDAVRTALSDMRHVHVLNFSENGPLAELLPEEVGGPWAELAALDSTRLLDGVFSAGGLLRPEDILLLDAALSRREPQRADLPLVLLMHHHLVPTPVTDRGRIQTKSVGWLKRATIERLVPWFVTHGDHEELTMTALGAGTAISVLHALGRPVIVLHGHKHYSAVRLLAGPHDGDGDLLVAGAGSAGMAEAWEPTEGTLGAAIWPSFNVLTLGASTLVERVRFSPKDHGLAPERERLIALRREGSRWSRQALAKTMPSTFSLLHNLATFELHPSRSSRGRYDVRCERLVLPAPEAVVDDYEEVVEGAPGSILSLREGAVATPGHLSTPVVVPYGAPFRYDLRDGACRTTAEAESAYAQKGETYEWLGLMNRYPAHVAELRVKGLSPGTRAFGSSTDLGTGEERPARLSRGALGDNEHVLRVDGCTARTLLRIYWTLE
jgi:Calcineurin-like phosphoesterase